MFHKNRKSLRGRLLWGARGEGGREFVVIRNRLSDKAPRNKIKQASTPGFMTY
jgi:hypothetical protein